MRNLKRYGATALGLLLVVACVAAMVCVFSAWADTQTKSVDLAIDNATDTVGLTIQKGANTRNFLECYRGSTLKFAVPNGGLVTTGTGAAAARIQAGTCTTADDSTVTNTFPIAFAAAPIVTTTVVNATTVVTNTIISVTTTNFVLNLGSNAKVANWIAVGTF